MTSTAIGTVTLPGLRQELRIDPGTPLASGAPGWILFDPVRHSFFQLGKTEFRIFSHWARGTLAGLYDELDADGLNHEQADAAISRVVDFSLQNNLTTAPMEDAVAAFMTRRRIAQKAWWRWMVDNYLFFRIPLVRPAKFLERALPHLAPLWSTAGLTMFALMAALGLLLVAREWDNFLASFSYFFNLPGIIAYGFGLAVVKIAHELGHATQATRFGVRVPTMGISFLVMMPVLYTDTTGAWRLRSRRQRLIIDLAGVTAELMIASVATLLWVLLPEGALRSSAFVLATTSWAMSVAVNLNPFMRYDGYYILSDLLAVPNLQPRAFALGRWRLRKLLFGLNEPVPEAMPGRLRRLLILYAWTTWIYRLVLFLGIAVLVYHLFFKALGIILFVVEITMFVLRPIVGELRLWYRRRAAILGRRRGRWTLGIAGTVLLLALLPLDRHVSAPAVLGPIGATPLVAGDPARIERVFVRNGQHVDAGAPIMQLSAPELDRDIAQRRVNIAELEAQLDRSASDRRDLSNHAVLTQQLATERGALAGLADRRTRLLLRAPIAGVVTDIESDMQPGRSLGGAEILARVVTPDDYDVQAYVAEDDIWRLQDGALARFVPDDAAQPSRRAKLVERATSAVQSLDQPILASTYGGAIAVNLDEAKRLKPRAALYRVRLIAEQGSEGRSATLQQVPGRVVIVARSTSFFDDMLGHALRILRQEASLT